VFRPDACIRPAAPADAANLAALARRVFAATYGAAIPAPTLRDYFHDHMTPARFRAQIVADPLFVAAADAGLAGYARISVASPPACVGDSGAVELAQLYVDAAYQGRGLGARLLAAASAAAAEAPIWLCAWEQNERALRFYMRHGFMAVGRMAVYVREVVFDDLVLVRGQGDAMMDDGRWTMDDRTIVGDLAGENA
jgi:ribosomal protein S18 acetylase RimI-like enzyme